MKRSVAVRYIAAGFRNDPAVRLRFSLATRPWIARDRPAIRALAPDGPPSNGIFS
ncbi:hypothetical protein GCM10011390_33650 [Aureimonas endophytica]|uniref:Uncharacterized protein n=1 Tax=Aureimonas endophytica TaxID=2027858 RepID=A0A916ZT24_9HYPH|nr:hypothetical protein GCM10011390_33650 [Aureimonas endophytica]